MGVGGTEGASANYELQNGGAQHSTALAGQGPQRWCERQGANCSTTCLEEGTLPRTKGFYLSVNVT